MRYLVLQRFRGLALSQKVRFEAGDIIDDRHHDITKLRAAGASLIEYEAEMESAVEAFLSAINKEEPLESLLPYLYSLRLVGIPKMVKAQALAQAPGNHSLTGLSNKFVAKTIFINTDARSWSLTLFSSNDYISDPLYVVQQRAGRVTIFWDTPYEDTDESASLHYNFTDHLGANTHDILVVGTELR